MTDFKNCILLSGKGPRDDMQDHGIKFKTPQSKNSFFLISDGIGGQPNGSDAASITIECLLAYLQNTVIPNDIKLFKECVCYGLKKVQQQFITFIAKNPAAQTMGCALCGIVVAADHLDVFWSGDCRLYIIRNEKIIYATVPHTWAFDLFRQGVFSDEEAYWSPQNFLTASVNATVPELRFDVHSFVLVKKDKLLICSDGIWNAFDQIELNEILIKKSFLSVSHSLRGYLKKWPIDNYMGYLIEC